jgi:hypothetical protein
MKAWIAAAPLAWSILIPSAAVAQDEADFDERVTTVGNIGLTISNYGKQGNDFRDRSSSFEFPARSGQEHMTRGGIWVGGIVLNDQGTLDTLVTTSVNDALAGSLLGLGAEFSPRRDPTWPLGANFLERSRQPSDPFFSADAIADQEIIAIADDTEPIGTGPDQHGPLSIKVKQEALVWGFEPFDGVVFLNVEITNLSPSRDIFDLYVGIYGELTTGDKSASTRWPPGSAWFGSKDIAYVDSLRLVYESRVRGIANDEVYTDSYGGIQVLGVSPGSADERTTTFTWWEWRETTPQTDAERYRVMSAGTIDGTEGEEYPNHDPVNLTSIGPFTTLGTSEADTVRFSIAYIGGIDREDLFEHALAARDAYASGFQIPVPPTQPRFLVEPGPHAITLRWDDSPESVVDPQTGLIDFEGYRVYISRSSTSQGFELLKEADVVDTYQFPEDATQEDLRFNTGLDGLRADDPLTVIAGGDTLRYVYKYVIRNLRDGFKYWTAVTAFDRGAQDIGPLETGIGLSRTLSIPGTNPVSLGDGGGRVSVFPNPYRGDAVWDGEQLRDRYLWFVNLPQRCTIRIFTLGGDLVDEFRFDGRTYDARDVRGLYDPTDPRDPEGDLPLLPGGMAAWDLITQNDQAVATGLYLFSVEDHDSGKRQVGKFLVLK